MILRLSSMSKVPLINKQTKLDLRLIGSQTPWGSPSFTDPIISTHEVEKEIDNTSDNKRNGEQNDKEDMIVDMEGSVQQR